jgi:deoxyadenosine/deoxycytidine kinase
MASEEFHLYEELLNNMLEHVSRPRLMVYLNISVENAIKRIAERGRDYEQIVPNSYWERLNEQYTDYFRNYNFSDILVIDYNELDVRHDPQARIYVMDLIKERLALPKHKKVLNTILA